jgi:Tol biopolymer transport system component
VFAPDGLGRVELTDNGTIEEYSPDWSPDGKRVVFIWQILGGTVTRLCAQPPERQPVRDDQGARR